MLGYYDVFPDKQSTDLRVAFFKDDGLPSSLPFGTYLFTEYYCNNLACDCQRLLIKCLYLSDEKPKPEEVASFSYTWNENPEPGWAELIGDIDNPFLDPLHFQTEYAAELMEFWHDMFCNDERYANRLKLHYFELREKFGDRAEKLEFIRRDAIDSAAPLWESPMDRNRRYKALRKSQSKRSNNKR